MQSLYQEIMYVVCSYDFFLHYWYIVLLPTFLKLINKLLKFYIYSKLIIRIQLFAIFCYSEIQCQWKFYKILKYRNSQDIKF